MKRMVIAAYLLLLFFCAFLRLPAFGQPSPRNERTLALVGAKIYPSPAATPIINGTVIVKDGRILAVGESGKVKIPREALRIDCEGLVMVAAFWNNHVHFTEDKWRTAETQPAVQLAENLRTMFTRYGFMRVLDTGSSPRNTQAIRRRVESGEVDGPSIMTTGSGFVPKDGSPVYLLPNRLRELSAPADADKIAGAQLDAGVDGIKLFTGSWATENSVAVMPVDVVRAVTTLAHRRGKFVVAHPSDSRGAWAAVEGGVDILVHTFPEPKPLDRNLFTRMSEARMGLVPTLKLFKYELERNFRDKPGVEKQIELVVGAGGEQLLAFSEAGGQILFGTDVGYMTDYDPTDEYLFMRRAGLSFPQILASLTTAPAERFGASKQTGALTTGMDADLVLLAGDPATDIKALSNVRYTLRRGKIIYHHK